jgi:hypothetical protein
VHEGGESDFHWTDPEVGKRGDRSGNRPAAQ